MRVNIQVLMLLRGGESPAVNDTCSADMTQQLQSKLARSVHHAG